MKTLLLLAALWPAAQDDPTRQNVARLIEQLKSEEAAERESAVRELTKLGAEAVPFLQEAMKGDDLELRGRVKEAIKAIQIASRVKDLNRVPRTVTADLQNAPLEDIVRAIEQQTGLKIDAAGVPAGHRFPFASKQLPLLQALDRLCTESDLLTYDWTGQGALRLSVGKWLPYPAAYAGAFRLRIKSLQVVRTQTFEKHAALLQFVVEPDHDPLVKPLRNWSLQIDEILDDQGGKLERAKSNEGRQWQMAHVTGDSRAFEFGGLSPRAVRLAGLRATVSYSFPTETQEVVLESPARGSSQEVGRFRVLVTTAATDSVGNATNLELTFSPIVGTVADLRSEIESRFEAASVILVDAEGVEHPAVRVQDDRRFMFRETAAPREIEYQFKVAKRLQRSDRKALKLQFHKETWQKAAVFEFKDVPLP